MSVNGDLMVIRNGRSTSQVSVYNYPEHLNPFYEDDNHKRLRFWKINKGAKDGQGRRNSFSLGGLKDMWAFKSFRMKKKSSSLGINKTSESPPPLRRDIYPNENGYGTYDPRMRYTTGTANGLGGEMAFQRNATYRSSLQDMRNNNQDSSINGFGFNRNDRYRSTIQTASTSSGPSASSTPNKSLAIPAAPRRYVYRGSVTPQPVRNNDFKSDTLGMMSRGSSQASVASTNPFEDDDDDDVVVVNQSASHAKHPARKKRRAPPPPVPVHQVIKEENSSGGSTPSHKAIGSTTAEGDERLEIHNLTAEIESFVKLTNSDSPERVSQSPTSSSTTTTTTTTTIITNQEASKSPKQNGTIPKVHVTSTVKTNGSVPTSVDVEEHVNAGPLFIKEDHDEEVVVSTKDSPVKIVESPTNTPAKEVGHVEAIVVHVDSPRSSPEKIEPSRVSTFRAGPRPTSPEKKVQQSSQEKLVTTTTLEVVEVHKPAPKPVEELKIKESPEKPKIAAKPSLPKTAPPVSPKMSAPATPAMRRREIKIEADLPSSPETNHREVGIDVGSTDSPTPMRREVTVKVENVTTSSRTTVADGPVPAVRERKILAPERTSPLPAARKVVVTETEINLSSKQEPKVEPSVKQIEVEEKILNVAPNVSAATPEQPQLKIAESKENIPQVEEAAALEMDVEPDQGAVGITPPATTTPSVSHPAPIEKPPRAKHFVEEFSAEIYRPRPPQWKQSTLAPLEPVPPEKRRSVKQIIESINRSQRLLSGKKADDDAANATSAQDSASAEGNANVMEQNLKSLAESQREMKRMLEELEGLENAHDRKLSNKSDENFQGILDNILLSLANETAKRDNTEIFKKCTITKEVNNNASRESSPTSSNLDWNPVPKPKRTKNLSPQLEVKKNNNNNNTDTEDNN